jgi:hypothetical protein
MRPNTAHAVFTPDNVICHGGHFYATSTIQDTMFGLVNTFISPDRLTNAEKPTHGLVLRRIAAFYHDALVQKRLEEGGESLSPSSTPTPYLTVSLFFTIPEYEQGHLPKLEDFNSVLDLFTFCNLVVLMNVLDFRTYQTAPGNSSQTMALELLEKHDFNSIPAIERYEIAHARGRCWDIFSWFFSKYELFDEKNGEKIDGFNQVAMPYLAHQGSVILECLKRARKIDKDAYLHWERLERQMKLCFRDYEEIPAITPPVQDRLTLAFSDASTRYGVREQVGQRHECKCLH